MWIRFFLALLLICIALKLLSTVARQLSGKKARRPVEETPLSGINEMVQDPVCGLFIPAREAVSLSMTGRTIHFCSDECRQRFMNAQR
ncbi:MAG TPA: hypothetical protein VK463_16920 [Desulfomonilaceae bacterium]|nr:hypothetical protein [Desulfomonilaceae bacterium]